MFNWENQEEYILEFISSGQFELWLLEFLETLLEQASAVLDIVSHAWSVLLFWFNIYSIVARMHCRRYNTKTNSRLWTEI